MKLEIRDAPWNIVSSGRVIISDLESHLKKGDVVELRHKEKSVIVTVHDIEKREISTITLDKYLRSNLNVNIGDLVDIGISAVSASGDAEIMEVMLPRGIRVDVNELKHLFLGRFVRKGMSYLLPTEGVQIQIGNTTPSGTVAVVQSTIIQIADSNVSRIPQTDVIRPTECFADIGGLGDVKLALQENIVFGIEKKDLYEKYGFHPSKGILLCGPPGTGKTMLARSVANESKANFRYVAASEMKDKWYGESERRLREIFAEAKQRAPSILFFDEIDAIAETRYADRVSIVQQLLSLMDEIAQSDVYVIAATNKVELIDQGLLRPGRFRVIEVRPPDQNSRKEIFRIHLSGTPSENLDLDVIASSSEGFTGAQIMGICENAKIKALRENQYSCDTKVKQEHIMAEIQRVRGRIGAERPDIYKR